MRKVDKNNRPEEEVRREFNLLTEQLVKHTKEYYSASGFSMDTLREGNTVLHYVSTPRYPLGVAVFNLCENKAMGMFRIAPIDDITYRVQSFLGRRKSAYKDVMDSVCESHGIRVMKENYLHKNMAELSWIIDIVRARLGEEIQEDEPIEADQVAEWRTTSIDTFSSGFTDSVINDYQQAVANARQSGTAFVSRASLEELRRMTIEDIPNGCDCPECIDERLQREQ